jgi:hypothetical protein
LIERNPKRSGRQIGFASPIPRIRRCTPMLLQQGAYRTLLKATEFTAAGQIFGPAAKRSRPKGRRR